MVWLIATKFGTVTQFKPFERSTVKISKFKKVKTAAAASLKIEKPRYLGNGITDRHQIWHGDAHIGPIRPVDC